MQKDGRRSVRVGKSRLGSAKSRVSAEASQLLIHKDKNQICTHNRGVFTANIKQNKQKLL